MQVLGDLIGVFFQHGILWVGYGHLIMMEDVLESTTRVYEEGK